jgi:hypothetical protein
MTSKHDYLPFCWRTADATMANLHYGSPNGGFVQQQPRDAPADHQPPAS